MTHFSAGSFFAGKDKDQYRKSFPVVESDFTKIRTGMSQSVTEHLNTEASLVPYLGRKSRSMKFAVKDEMEGDWSIVTALCFHWLKFKFSNLNFSLFDFVWCHLFTLIAECGFCFNLQIVIFL